MRVEVYSTGDKSRDSCSGDASVQHTNRVCMCKYE
jgi:hypothetical protein